jgi:amidase
MHDLVYQSAVTLAGLIRTRQVSAMEVLTAHLERIAVVNPLLNALVQPAGQAALADARRLDAHLARGLLRGPLHGVPFSVKEWIETAGLVCAAGDERRRDCVPDRDATAVARLRSAGGILLGKTNVTVTNPVYGRTNNPYDIGRSPSGSSSGEAALIASGGSPLGLGSDSGAASGHRRTPAASPGSSRRPAACPSPGTPLRSAP